MTAVLYPPQLGPAQSSYPPPTARGPSRAVVGAAVISLLASLASVTLAAITWTTAPSGSKAVVQTPASTQPDASKVAAARSKACQLWSSSANVMDDATNAVAQAPADWHSAATQEALANEARVISVESNFLLRQLPADTPAEIRSGIGEYVTASFDMENATTHRKGTARDTAIHRANEAENKVTAACQ